MVWITTPPRDMIYAPHWRTTLKGNSSVTFARLFFVVTTCIFFGCTPENRDVVRTGAAFVSVDSRYIYNINDVGLGQLGGNQSLDLWTTNHSSRQWTFLDPVPLIEDSTNELGLNQDKDWPGIESDLLRSEGPPSSLVDVWIRFEGDSLVFESLGKIGYAFGVRISWPVAFTVDGGATTESLSGCLKEDNYCTAHVLNLPASSKIEILPLPPPSDGFPIDVSVIAPTSDAAVVIGRLMKPLDSSNFSLHLKDRHGIAMADLAGDSQADIFISRGGARGMMDRADPAALDELLVAEDGRYLDRTPPSGITKYGCPGRQTELLDVDQDGDLDIYQVCGRGRPPNNRAKNRLYVQEGRGRFGEQAEQFGIAFEGVGHFEHLPSDAGGAAIAWITGDSLVLYSKDEKKFVERCTLENVGGRRLVFLPRREKSTLHAVLISGKQNYWLEFGEDPCPSAMNLEEIGVPGGSIDGGYVDIDGDLNDELLLIPQGIFSRGNDGKWHHQPELAFDTRRPLHDARQVWTDFDQDGDLDLWLFLKDAHLAPQRVSRAIDSFPILRDLLRSLTELVLNEKFVWEREYWFGELFENKNDGRTIEVRLQGVTGNRQAIGAMLSVDYADGETRLFTVGHFDLSAFSHTNFSMYVPNPPYNPISGLTALFPDGARASASANDERLITIEHPDQGRE